ncbi:MAG: IS256 family transposase [Eggerthellaceae bacterium]|nr:IS256 family transposase [Eggerthellaceae bacterium]MBQ9955304.1 IS256 family transposase [Eggerthellaceae bacterium]MBR2803762.1 IS256 family transposase [Eggerthellaceae bacterium]
MDTVQEKEAFKNLPFREDGTIDINEMMRRELEHMVNQIMDWQADELRGEGNRRNGYRERKLVTVLGEITMRIPKLREGTYFPDELIRPYSRVDRAMVAIVKEVYVRGLSTRKIEKAANALEFASLSPSRVSRMTAELDEEVAALNAARFDGMAFPYLWLDATYLSCRDEGHVQSKGVVTTIACGEDGSRRFVGFGVVDTESAVSWKAFLRGLRRRGVTGVKCVVSDDHEGLVQAIAEVFQGAAWQRCIVHLERNVAGWFSKKEEKLTAIAAMKAVFAERDPQLVRAAYRQAAERIAQLKAHAGELLEDAEADALAYLDFPYEHHVRLRTNNVQERANEEIKRRTKVVGVFPSVESMMRLVGSVLIDVNEEWLEMNFIDAASLKGVCRSVPDCAPIPADVVELARIRVMAAIEEKLGKAA